ncbi:Zn(II)2Cys6 transcription factor [Aspergillus violaceofuscus CBS 115571]|uniref:Zn(II)2Cys6 transcription factor n=1 Tax=Aspergillus violaceofuscus (strain CBS 115571) TaxID=1450538 RepID=A0A2V5GW56_ASPV1|nr:Zn(II)2Cys6 transcription factor [Aspergillus violaceofuscus CBS 115571]
MDNRTLPPDTRSMSHARQAACMNCRKSKVRCNRTNDETSCDRCRQADATCVIPSHHVGRQKGVKNKRKGLEKALHQIEQAIKRPRAEDVQNLISNLRGLLDNIQEQNPHSETDCLSEEPAGSPSISAAEYDNPGDSLSLDDAENPLQLLARASDLQLSPNDMRGVPELKSSTILHPSGIYNVDDGDTMASATSFFIPISASLDTGPTVDPIELGLVTLDEAESLFLYFYRNLAHTRWGLDPLIHSVPFVRSQSAFLFTSIIAAAALFLPSAAAISKRLSRHRATLAHNVITQRHRSVEIVLAFMVNVPWMGPGNRLGDDDTCIHIAMALTVALDLSLNKIVLPSTSFDSSLLKRLAKADCIDAKRALQMDGFGDVASDSVWGRRLLRRRERAWIALFVLERGVCLARGRNYTVPSTALIENCDKWHLSDIADSRDGPMNSMAVLRRNLDGLLKRIRAECDNSTNSGSGAAQLIKHLVESFYGQWYKAWTPAIGEGQASSLPPYVEILVIHTQLSTYGGVINHPTAPLEVKRFFRAAGLSSALNVLRAAIQGESRLKSMPNNTVIMISFAACSALSLSAMPANSRSSLAPSVRNLVEETATVLERIGAAPAHRNGTSVLYGRFLRELIRRSPPSLQPEKTSELLPLTQAERSQPPTTGGSYEPVIRTQELSSLPSMFWSEPIQFSAMSDDQIIDAVNQVDTAFGTFVPGIPMDDLTHWDWLDFGSNNATDISSV